MYREPLPRHFGISLSGVKHMSRYYLILAQDLVYGKTEKLMALLEEVSRLLNAYSKAIQAGVASHSDS
jgi:hypothetical protein